MNRVSDEALSGSVWSFSVYDSKQPQSLRQSSELLLDSLETKTGGGGHGGQVGLINSTAAGSTNSEQLPHVSLFVGQSCFND